MRCENARTHISREVDGELPSKQRDAVRQHVEGCADCARFARRCLEMQRLVKEPLAEIPDRSYWDGLLARVERAMEQGAGRSAVRARTLQVLAYAAAAACLVLLAAVALQRTSSVGLRAELVRLKAGGTASPAGDYDLRQMARFVEGPAQSALAEQAQAFRILDDYLQGGLRWVVQDGSQTELGMSGDFSATGGASPGKPVLVEIQLVRAGGAGDTHVVSAPTLMIVPGEEANFRLAASNGIGPKRFRYRCAASESPAGEAHVVVALELIPEGSEEPIRLSAALALDSVDRVPAAYSRVGDVSYLLLLSIRRSDEGSRVETSL